MWILAQDDSSSAAGTTTAVIITLAIIVITLVGYWKLFTKIGLPGWMGIVPFVNVYMIFKARGLRSPVLWLILSLIPIINIVAAWFLASDTAEIFAKGFGWKLFLFFIPGLSHLILAFGSSQAYPPNVARGVGINA